MAKRLIEKRQRGPAGWFFLIVFWGWNLFMAWAVVLGMESSTERYAELSSEAERTGAAIGTGLGFMFLLVIWAAGAVVTGLAAYFTRGRRELIELDD